MTFGLRIIVVFISININSYGQALSSGSIPAEMIGQLDKMGVDPAPLLNPYESKYFNEIFKLSRGGFDFTDKKVGFLTGSTGTKKCSKADYFEMEKYRPRENHTHGQYILYIFDARQKEETGGFDAVILFWCKVLLPHEKVGERIKR